MRPLQSYPPRHPWKLKNSNPYHPTNSLLRPSTATCSRRSVAASATRNLVAPPCTTTWPRLARFRHRHPPDIISSSSSRARLAAATAEPPATARTAKRIAAAAPTAQASSGNEHARILPIFHTRRIYIFIHILDIYIIITILYNDYYCIRYIVYILVHVSTSRHSIMNERDLFIFFFIYFVT